jgi:CRP-like cAMP-binding protein
MVAHGNEGLATDPRRGRSAVDVLAGIPLFRVLSQECVSAAVRAGRFKSYAAGQIIFHQGDPGDHLYVVIKGLVKVVFTSERGDEIVLNIRGPEEIFGELALLDGSPRSASVVVLQPTSVFVLSRRQLLELMSSNPGLADGFLKLIGKLVRKLTEQVGDLTFLDLKGRLAKLLLQLSVKDDDGPGVVLDVALTQSDLAEMIGASRPAVNRALQSFVTRGLIEMHGRTIVLRDLDNLRRRSQVRTPTAGFSLPAERAEDH